MMESDHGSNVDQQRSEPPEDGPQESDNTSSTSDSSDDVSSVGSDGIVTTEMDFHQSKLLRLRQHYNDAYLDLFNQTFNRPSSSIESYAAECEIDAEEFSSSQIGSVLWTATEKAKFFSALSRLGRHDLPGISRSIGTKSQIETKAFLELLDESFVDRQMFERETKNISSAEIPAAIEISQDLEEKLEQAADALQVVQEGYDLAAGRQRIGTRWIVTKKLARILDNECDEKEDLSNSNADGDDKPREPHMLFHLQTWLDSCEKFFMNWSPEADYDHWSTIAEPDQRPSLTMETIADLHRLTISLTQRILQVALFMAKSRIRASMNISRRPAKILTQGDVHAALDVLQMKHDSWDYWARLPRRNKMKVYSDMHRKGKKSRTFLEISAVEETLLHMSKSRLSKSRSRSRGRSMSQDTDDLHEGNIPEEQSIKRSPAQGPTAGQSTNTETSEDSGGESQTTDSEARVEPLASEHVSRKRKRQLLEEAQDNYADRVDRIIQAQHEHELWQIFSEPHTTTAKEEDVEELGPRPKTLRKTREEIHDWVPTYESEWERDFQLRTTPD